MAWPDLPSSIFYLPSSSEKLVEPEVVATSPNRIKSPVPVCCGFSSLKLVLAAGFAPALATLSTSCLCWLDYASKGNGASSRCCPGRISLQKKSAGCCKEAKMVAVPSAALGTAGV